MIRRYGIDSHAMIRWCGIVLAVLLSLPARADGLARASCLACHSPKPEQSRCVRCHSPGWREDRRILYGKAPELKPRYTRAGLVRFLKDPQDRWHGKGSMFALTDKQMHAMRDFVNSNPNEAPPDQNLVQAGQKLFIEQGCVTCHANQGPGPLLQLGYPFLNQRYFKASVQQGKGRMPAFPHLQQADIKAIYAYISLSPRPITAEPEALNLSVASGERLYRRVMHNLTQSGCVHCHGSPDHAAAELTQIFGTSPRNFFLSPHSIDPRSRPALESKPGCQDSILVERLERRVAETTGQRHPERGMPLTGTPWTKAAIREVRQWSRLGCPDGTGLLCSPCVSTPAPKSSFGEMPPKLPSGYVITFPRGKANP